MCQEFGPYRLHDLVETLVKLGQVGTLRDYVIEFRRLANCTSDINPSLLKSCFDRGLKPELKHDVKLLKPRDVLEASAFAQQIDSKLTDLKVKFSFKSLVIQPNFRSPLQYENTTYMVENRSRFNNVRRLIA